MTVPLPFTDLTPGEDASDIRAAIERVSARGWFVLGPELDAFEQEFARASGALYAVGVGNGTDAITLLLRATGIGPGDEVIVPALTAGFTALAVFAAGASPVVADVDPSTLTLDVNACADVITRRTRAIVPVHLYGQAADLTALSAFAADQSVDIVEDCCQAHLATWAGRPVGTTSRGGAFSFYPTKNLGALGDGGAIITGDPDLAARVRALRNGGQRVRHHHAEAGINSRLDEIQAAILRARLPRLDAWTRRRRAIAHTYRSRLTPRLTVPAERDAGHVYHLFPVRSPHRDRLQKALLADGIETLIHYPMALPEQQAFAAHAPLPCPVASTAAAELLSLPLRPTMKDDDVERVIEAVNRFGDHHPVIVV